MKTRYFLLAVAFTLLLVLGYGVMPTLRTSVAAPAPADDASFKGKVLVVLMDSQHSHLLEQAQVRKIGDHCFLVGKGVDVNPPGNWTKGRSVWLPMGHVDVIVEFENVEEMSKAWKEAQKNMPAVSVAPQLPEEKPPPAKQPQ